MSEVFARPQDLHEFSDLRIPFDEDLKAYDAETLGKSCLGTRAVQKDAYTDYLPSKLEPTVVPFSSAPTLPLPEPTVSDKKRKREDVEEIQRPTKKVRIAEEKSQEEQPVFKPVAHFGMPFNTSDGSEIGLTPHPQLVMARTLEDCTHTMAVGRAITAQTIIKGDHRKQDELSSQFDEKLKESIQIAKENQQLNYIQNVLKFLTITVGIGGGLIVSLGSASINNGWGVFYGMEMVFGGFLELGSFCLDQIGYKETTWTSLMAIGGAVLAFHGGLMGNNLLFEKLPKHLSAVTTSVIAALRGYGLMRTIGNQAASFEFFGELTSLTKERKIVSDDTKKHYGALNISDFKLLFKTAEDFINQMNQATKKIVQGTLKG